MKILKTAWFLAVVSVLIPVIPTPGSMAAVVSIGSTGSGTFVVQGASFSDVSAVEITISYDTNTLASPRVAQRSLVSGALFMSDLNSPGSIRITAVRTQPVSGSGPIATISFTRTGTSPGRILSMNAGLTNAKGASVPAQVLVANPTETAADTPGITGTTGTSGGGRQTSSTTGGTEPTGGGGSSTSTSAADTTMATGGGSRHPGPGTITIPGQEAATQAQQPTADTTSAPDETEAKESAPAKAPVEAPPEQQAAPESPPAAQMEKSAVKPVSVLGLFREYKGEKTPQSLVALFDSGSTPGARQEPAIALSDGVSRVKVYIKISRKGGAAPNFALKGARLTSLKMAGDEWVLEVLPDKNVFEASISVLDNGVAGEIPLTVVPPMDANRDEAGVLGEREFNLFLKEKGTDKAPRFDLNKDKKRDYIDEYIFTANYIFKRASSQKTNNGMKK